MKNNLIVRQVMGTKNIFQQILLHNIKESKSNKNADSYLPHGNTILVAPPGGQSVMDINAD